LETKLCGRCHEPVPASFTKKDICRNCGNYWRSEEEVKAELSSADPPSPLSRIKLVASVVIMCIILALISLGLIKFLNNQRLDESFITGLAIQESLARYAAAENNVYPGKIEDWAALVYVWNLNATKSDVPLKFTAEDQGMKFLKYQTMDGNRSYLLWLEVRGVPKDTQGKILEISPSGVKKLNAGELEK